MVSRKEMGKGEKGRVAGEKDVRVGVWRREGTWEGEGKKKDRNEDGMWRV